MPSPRKEHVSGLSLAVKLGWKKHVEDAGGEALAVPTNVSDVEQVDTAAETVEDEFGPIDVWVNTAMASVFSPAKDMEADEY